MRRFTLLAILSLTLVLSAQSDRGTITGTVSDPAGAVVASAPIQARNVETGVVYESATSTTGNYTIAQLPAGTYEVSVGVAGFKKYTRAGLAVQVAQTMRIDVTLEVGATTDSVTITEAAPLLRTESGELSHNVSVKQMDDLPILGIGAGQAGSAGIRNPMAMVQLIPGTVWTPNSVVRVNGAPANSQSFRVEGQEAGNTGLPGTPAQTQPSVDAIQEVAIQTSNYAAEYGQVGGGVFNVTMRSGVNRFHGSAYDYFVNEVFNAGNPFTLAPAGTGNPRSVARRHDYGFTLGGPVAIPKVYDGHDKTFFFFNFEQYRERVTFNNQFQTVPTVPYRAGDFTTALTNRTLTNAAGPILDPAGRTMIEGMIYDPSSTKLGPDGRSYRDPFVGNKIPSAAFDPVAAKIQALFPPSRTGSMRLR
ncbi:MAG: TonB-dependent receptor plug [Bryobacterales bacterium]|nr:TonB-dependent receptor plug [Bryobacterales bacterium]